MNKIDDNKYLEWFKDYFRSSDEKLGIIDEKYYKEWIDYLKEKRDKDELVKYWGSVLYGRLGMAVRNFMRKNHPEIDEDFKENYDGFEDYTWYLLNKMIDEEY